jgi:hypothetical protein
VQSSATPAPVEVAAEAKLPHLQNRPTAGRCRVQFASRLSDKKLNFQGHPVRSSAIA